jgi:hypothetical protein
MVGEKKEKTIYSIREGHLVRFSVGENKNGGRKEQE